MTAPTPSSKAPTTMTVRIISPFSILPNISIISVSTTSVSKRCRQIAGARGGHDPFSIFRIPTPPIALDSSAMISKAVPAMVFTDRDPDPLGGSRHIDVIDLVFAPQPLDDRVDDRRTGADRAGPARALDPQRIGLAGHVVGLEHEGRTVGRARHRIVHEGAGDELAVVGAVHRLL